VFAAVSSMKTIRVGSRSSCPSNHASRAAFSALRRCSAACAELFARDLATFEEPPERADGHGDAALLQPLAHSASVMSLLAATAERITSACASIRCEWRAPPCSLGRQ
jgi:hypothetical protein